MAAFDSDVVMKVLALCRDAADLSIPRPDALPPWAPWETIRTPNDLILSLVAALREQTELAIFDGRMQQIEHSAFRVTFEGLASWLIERAVRVGPEKAVDDLRRYVEEDKYEVEETCLITGVKIANPIEVAHGIFLVSFEDLPTSQHKDMFSPTMWTYGSGWPTSALTCQNAYPKHHGNEMIDVSTRRGEMDDIRLILTLIGPCCPVVVAFWSRAADWVPLSGKAIALSSPFNEGQARGSVDLSAADTERLRELYSLFKNLPSVEREHLRVPLDRLNRASRWSDRTTSAIELGIALEALLLNDLEDDRGELGLRLRLRGARLLGETLEARKQIDRLLKLAYAARSIAVHTGNLPERLGNMASAQILEEGRRLAARAIEVMLRAGGAPDWGDVLLG